MKLIKKDEKAIDICAAMLREKKIIILPTDTVYGFSGIIGETERKIKNIKGRDEGKPFIVLIHQPDEIYTFTNVKIPSFLFNFWPGALTIIVPLKETGSTLALRCPGDFWLRQIIKKCGNPIYSTSVNRSGQSIVSSIKEIIDEFKEDVSLIVDGGDCIQSSASTIVSCLDGSIKIIRQGSLIIPEEFLK